MLHVGVKKKTGFSVKLAINNELTLLGIADDTVFFKDYRYMPDVLHGRKSRNSMKRTLSSRREHINYTWNIRPPGLYRWDIQASGASRLIPNGRVKEGDGKFRFQIRESRHTSLKRFCPPRLVSSPSDLHESHKWKPTFFPTKQIFLFRL